MFMAAIGTEPLPEKTTMAITPINGRPAIVAAGSQGAFSTMSFDVDADGLITALYLMAAPSKLTHLTGPVA